jgi:inosine/xanthosine triphosphate pyrophosphatase family protein
MAELSVDEKHEISHRGRALRALAAKLRERSSAHQ